jgi:hypothetical protein
MSLLAPLFLAGGLAVALPIAMHLLRRKTRHPVAFPSLRFLGPQIIRDEQRHRLRRLIVLLLRCLIIGLIALAFARPFFGQDSSREGRLILFLVDNSFSMQAGDRWERVKTWALDEARLRPGDEAGLMIMQPNPAWLIEPTGDLDRVREGLRGLTPGYQTTAYDRPLRYAAEVLSSSAAKETQLIVLADEQRLGWEGVNFSQPLAAGVKVRYAPPEPSPKRQAALTKLEPALSGNTLRLDLEAQLFSPEHDERMARVFSGTVPLGEVAVTLRAGTPTLTSFRVPLPAGNDFPLMLRVEMDRDDLPADDVRYAVVDPSQALPVIVSPGSGGETFVKGAVNATSAHRTLPLRAIDPPDGPWPADALVVIDGKALVDGGNLSRLREHLRAGRNALVFVDDSPVLAGWLSALGVTPELSRGENWFLTDCDLEHPVFETFTPQTLLPLLRVRFAKAWALGGENLQTIARWPDGSTAMAETRAEQGRLIVCGFNPSREASDLAISSSFVPLLHRALAGLAPTQHRQGTLVGDPILLPAGPGTLTLEDGPGTWWAENVSGSFRPVLPGVYRFQPANGSPRFYAVNLAPDESRLSPWPSPEDFARLESAEPRKPSPAPVIRPAESTSSQNLWWWLLMVVALLFLTELSLANRTAR